MRQRKTIKKAPVLVCSAKANQETFNHTSDAFAYAIRKDFGIAERPAITMDFTINEINGVPFQDNPGSQAKGLELINKLFQNGR